MVRLSLGVSKVQCAVLLCLGRPPILSLACIDELRYQVRLMICHITNLAQDPTLLMSKCWSFNALPGFLNSIICQVTPPDPRLHLLDFIIQTQPQMYRDRVCGGVLCRDSRSEHLIHRTTMSRCNAGHLLRRVLLWSWIHSSWFSSWAQFMVMYMLYISQIKQPCAHSQLQVIEAILRTLDDTTSFTKQKHALPAELCNMMLDIPRQGYDCEKDAVFHDITLVSGFVASLALVLRIKVRGLCWLGIPCQSFTFMSSSQHKRTWSDPYGCLCYPFVHMGNTICSRSCMVMLVALARSVSFFVENPLNSSLNCWPFMNYIMHLPGFNGVRTSWCGPQLENFVISNCSNMHLAIGCCMLLFGLCTGWWATMVVGVSNHNLAYPMWCLDLFMFV